MTYENMANIAKSYCDEMDIYEAIEYIKPKLSQSDWEALGRDYDCDEYRSGGDERPLDELARDVWELIRDSEPESALRDLWVCLSDSDWESVYRDLVANGVIE